MRRYRVIFISGESIWLFICYILYCYDVIFGYFFFREFVDQDVFDDSYLDFFNLIVFYYSLDEDDDDGDFFDLEDFRFVDFGWGGECL